MIQGDQDMDKNTSRTKKVFGIIGTVLFFVSYLPYVVFIEAGVHGVMSGLFGGVKLYGFEAMWNCFIWMCVVPIIPVCVIYQIVFGVVYIRKRRILKIVTIGLAVSLITAIVAAGLFAVNKNMQQLEAAKPQIEQYLTDKYGEGFINENTGIRLFAPDEDGYMVSTDVLPEGIEFAVYLSPVHDDLVDSFCVRNEDFRDGFTEYINEQYELPDNMSLEVNIDSIEFGSYQAGEDYSDLFPAVDYSVGGIAVDVDSADDDSVEDLIYEVWEELVPKFEDQIDSDFITMHISENGENTYYVVYYIDSGTASVNLYQSANRVSSLVNANLELP